MRQEGKLSSRKQLAASIPLNSIQAIQAADVLRNQARSKYRMSFKKRVKLVGTGQFGVVEAVQLTDGRSVAIKSPKEDADDEQIRQFQAEIRILQSLKHR